MLVSPASVDRLVGTEWSSAFPPLDRVEVLAACSSVLETSPFSTSIERVLGGEPQRVDKDGASRPDIFFFFFFFIYI